MIASVTAADLEKQPAEPRPLIGEIVTDFIGKKVAHWSYYIAIAGGIAGAIIAIAAVALGNLALLAPGIFFIATHVILGYYNSTFSEYAHLDTYVQILNDRIKQNNEELKQQKALNSELQKLNQDFKKQAAEQALKDKEQNDRFKADNNSLKQHLDALESELDTVNGNLKSKEEATLTQISKLMETITLKDKEINNLKETVAHLEGSVKEIATARDSLDNTLKESEKLIEEKKQLIFQLQEQVKALPSLSEIKKEIEELKALDKEGKAALQEASPLNARLQDLLKRGEEAFYGNSNNKS
jgi:chromosome segregation ATPase